MNTDSLFDTVVNNTWLLAAAMLAVVVIGVALVNWVVRRLPNPGGLRDMPTAESLRRNRKPRTSGYRTQKEERDARSLKIWHWVVGFFCFAYFFGGLWELVSGLFS